jgi:hypothetical protein
LGGKVIGTPEMRAAYRPGPSGPLWRVIPGPPITGSPSSQTSRLDHVRVAPGSRPAYGLQPGPCGLEVVVVADRAQGQSAPIPDSP